VIQKGAGGVRFAWPSGWSCLGFLQCQRTPFPPPPSWRPPGPWYTEGGEYDVGFIKILHHQCYKRIKEKRYCSIAPGPPTGEGRAAGGAAKDGGSGWGAYTPPARRWERGGGIRPRGPRTPKALVEWIAASEISNVPLYEPAPAAVGRCVSKGRRGGGGGESGRSQGSSSPYLHPPNNAPGPALGNQIGSHA